MIQKFAAENKWKMMEYFEEGMDDLVFRSRPLSMKAAWSALFKCGPS